MFGVVFYTIGKDGIIMMSGDVCGDWKIYFFHSMEWYALTMKNCGKVREGSNGGYDWILPQFQTIKDTSVVLNINKMIWLCVGKVGVFKSSDTVGTPIRRGSADDMVLNPTLDVLSAITHGGWNFQGENCILLYLKFSSIFCMQEEHLRENMM